MTNPRRTREAPGAQGREAVARLVAARRVELGMTQVALAERAGVSYRTIQNLEAAATWPQALKLAAIARALEIDAATLRAYAKAVA